MPGIVMATAKPTLQRTLHKMRALATAIMPVPVILCVAVADEGLCSLPVHSL